MNYLGRPQTEKHRTVKWDGQKTECLAVWVADLDYETAPEVVETFIDRSEQGHFGYQLTQDDYYRAVISWHQKGTVPKSKNWIIPLPRVVTSIKQAIDLWTAPEIKY